ncbi:hypothetical protein Micbo1qcDRAFT_194562 [Microdochium bolleyi]|uniref:Fucose-specific lectin n=1 Tax=Microdochium bolleyi TaxID=196109 RepID=A0A136J884_9PEZI|nr:hypothetical protein Micbo1qcDRAFT_194562 [Microdochium bolleyi]
MDHRLVRFLAFWASVWWLFAGSARAGAVTVWKPVPFAPQVVVQDDASGRFFYSQCNSNGTTIFANNVTYALDIDKKLLPRRNTRLASVGWSADGDWGAIQYQTNAGDIVHSLWLCNVTGQLVSQGQWIVSNVAPSVHGDTGLASVILGRNAGFRIYYQDEDNSTCALSYSVIQGNWKYEGVISHDGAQGSAFSAAWTTPEKIHIARSRGAETIEVARLHNNETWNLSTFPTPLKNVSNTPTLSPSGPSDSTNATDIALNTTGAAPWKLDAWDGKASAMGYTIDNRTEGGVASIFYIGTDARLHQVEEIAGGWQKVADQNTSFWPVADSGNSDFGSTYDNKTGEVWLYYLSGRNMIAAYRSADRQWHPARILDKSNATVAGPTPQDAASGGLTTQAKIGLGAGIGLGAVAIIGLAVFVMVLRRRRARRDAEKWQEQRPTSQKATSEPSSAHSPVSTTHEGSWPRYSNSSASRNAGAWTAEAHSQPVHELEEQVRPQELMVEVQTKR